ncbi:MAG: flagellar protein [Clostridium sp.]|nr:flagellar protein [Clostridium sp.]
MEVRTCKSCKKLFNYLSGAPICAACKDKLEAKFMEVREYVRENPKEGINEVAEANEVSTNQIRRWIREERLSFSAESGVGLDCENCGRLIRSGRYCESCKAKLNSEMNNMYASNEDSVVARKHREAARMRYIDK